MYIRNLGNIQRRFDLFHPVGERSYDYLVSLGHVLENVLCKQEDSHQGTVSHEIKIEPADTKYFFWNVCYDHDVDSHTSLF